MLEAAATTPSTYSEAQKRQGRRCLCRQPEVAGRRRKDRHAGHCMQPVRKGRTVSRGPADREARAEAYDPGAVAHAVGRMPETCIHLHRSVRCALPRVGRVLSGEAKGRIGWGNDRSRIGVAIDDFTVCMQHRNAGCGVARGHLSDGQAPGVRRAPVPVCTFPLS